MRTCNVCSVEKHYDDFGYTGKNKIPRGTCKKCRAEATRNHRKENPEVYRGYEYKKKYKITLEIYNKKLQEQDGVCAICKGTWVRPLVVDHDHDCCNGEYTCGKCLRALLCGNCNAGLGWFKNDIHIMESAIEYMKTVVAGSWK